jgi:hypothetical protein
MQSKSAAEHGPLKLLVKDCAKTFLLRTGKCLCHPRHQFGVVPRHSCVMLRAKTDDSDQARSVYYVLATSRREDADIERNCAAPDYRPC